jgi:cytochrome P450
MATLKTNNAGADETRPMLPGFDPLAHDFLTDPFPTWARAQATCPVFFYPEMNFWVLTRHEDVLRAVTDWKTFSSRAVGTVPPPPELVDRVPKDYFHDSFVAIDPPEHTVSRKAANSGFTRSRIAALEPAIVEIANRLIDGFIDDGQCDLMEQYCYQLSLRTIVRLLGLDDSDESLVRYRQSTEDMFSLLTPKAEDDGESNSTVRPMPDDEWRARWGRVADAIAYYRTLIDDRRATPRDDLISVLIATSAEDGSPALSDDKIITHIQEMIAAGNDTTANLMGALVLYLSQQPADFAELKARPELLPAAVEEGLRRRGSSIGMFRITTEDVTVSGVEIPEGSMVFLGFQAAGHDSELFPEPRRIDVHRHNADEHLAFGRGRHFCMGAPLARLEARLGLETLFRRIPTLEVIPDQPLEFAPTMTVSMLHHLKVRWT